MLRHSLLFGVSRLFPDATLRDTVDKFTKGLTTKAILQSTTKKTGDADKKTKSFTKTFTIVVAAPNLVTSNDIAAVTSS